MRSAMRRRRGDASGDGLLFGELPEPRSPEMQLTPTPVRPGVYGLAKAGALKCQRRIGPKHALRQCKFYGCEMVRGLPYCKRHARKRRAEVKIEEPRRELLEELAKKARALSPAAVLEDGRWREDTVVVNHFRERVWLKPCIVDGKRIGITDCCLAADPCERHAAMSDGLQ